MTTPALRDRLDPGTAVVSREQMERSVEDVVDQAKKIERAMKLAMTEGEHWGTIPGVKKPTLFKAGAEKLLLLFRLDPQYESAETRDGKHLSVTTTCTLYHIPTGQRFGSGMGSCSTMESKYAYREGKYACPHCGSDAVIRGKAEFGGGWLCWQKRGGCGAKFDQDDHSITSQPIGRVPNEDIADSYNTVLKMANKRALVAAVLNVTAASDVFTQDMEDFRRQSADEGDWIEGEARDVTPAPRRERDKPTGRPQPSNPSGAAAGKDWSEFWAATSKIGLPKSVVPESAPRQLPGPGWTRADLEDLYDRWIAFGGSETYTGWTPEQLREAAARVKASYDAPTAEKATEDPDDLPVE